MEGSTDPLQDNMYNKPEELNDVNNQNDNTPLTNEQQYAPPPMQPPSYDIPPSQPMQEQNNIVMPDPTPNYNATSQQPQPQYGQPIANAVPSNGIPNTIVINQQPQNTMVNPNLFKTVPIAMTCQFCNKPITSTVNKEFNFLACCLCFCTGLICYLIVQACRNKDLCFYNATHTCPYCGQVVGNYNAC